MYSHQSFTFCNISNKTISFIFIIVYSHIVQQFLYISAKHDILSLIENNNAQRVKIDHNFETTLKLYSLSWPFFCCCMCPFTCLFDSHSLTLFFSIYDAY